VAIGTELGIGCFFPGIERENPMQMSKVSLAVLAAVALAAGVGSASAQSTTTTTTTTISPDQETTIYRTITHEQVAVQPPPPDWAPSVGVVVPSQVQLYDMPTTVDVPSVRTDRYTVVNGHVVLVDPGTHRVVRVIER
jgi:Protein of unknown function (DUF1236)